MKALGYPRLISVENFRTPNFELVADALYWLVHRSARTATAATSTASTASQRHVLMLISARLCSLFLSNASYDPTAEVDENISSELHRVEFLKSVATVMMSKARVKLNIKQLYRADGYAVKELLKISSLLYDAIQLDGGTEAGGVSAADGQAEQAKSAAAADLSLSARLDELKEARNLAGEIVESGSKLFTLLGREGEGLKESRDRALTFLDAISSNLDSADPHAGIERNIREQISLLGDNLADLERLRDEADRESKNLKSKIDRKSTELERAEKRLKSLKKVKPAFLDEYEGLETELKAIYETYLERFRNLHYLEGELRHYHLAEMEKKRETDKQLKRMQNRLREEEMRILRGDQPVDENHIDQDEDDEDDQRDRDRDEERSDSGSEEEDDRRGGGGRSKGGRAGPGGRGRVTGGGGRPAAAGRNVVGSMMGGSSDDDSDDSDGSGGGGGHGGKSDESSSEEESDDDDELGASGAGGGRGGGGGSDDDDDDRGRPSGKPSQAPPGRGGGGGGGMSKPPGGVSASRAPVRGGGGGGRDDDSEPPSDDSGDDDEAF